GMWHLIAMWHSDQFLHHVRTYYTCRLSPEPADRQTNRQTDIDRHIHTRTDIHTDRHTHKNRQTDRQTQWRTDSHTELRTIRHLHVVLPHQRPVVEPQLQPRRLHQPGQRRQIGQVRAHHAAGGAVLHLHNDWPSVG
ncbi:hypothetical protein Vretimale_9721, partial [Volvox reticuliferus]